MNKRQNDILEFLALTDPSEFITQKEIAEKLGLSERNVGSECAKLSKDGFLQQDGTLLGEPLRYRISAKGQNHLDDERNKKVDQSYAKNLVLVTIGLLIVTGLLALGTI